MPQRFARLQRSPKSAEYVELRDQDAWVLSDAPWAGGAPTGERIQGVGELDPRLLTPVTPSKILCVGRNYRAHAQELGNEVPVEPMLFYKPPSSLLAPGGTIELPPESIASRIEHEAELCVVIGGELRRASEEQAAAAVFGLTLACDVTARDLQKKDGQWWRAKGMDTFCPVGPVVVSGVSPDDLEITCSVNGAQRQRGSTRNMIFSVPRVLAHVSQVITLLPGDLVLTGTPEGVGPLVPGDLLEISASGLGVLRAKVARSSS